MLLDDLRHSELAWLRPKFTLIGSIAEGTRLFQADELDISVKFEALQQFPLRVSRANACQLLVDEEHVLGRFCRRPGKGGGSPPFLAFNHERFLRYFLEAVRKSLLRIEVQDGWPKTLSFNGKTWMSCPACRELTESRRTSLYHPQTHCPDRRCLPMVAHSKVGSCLVFQWRGGRLPLNVDLVPVFPVRSPERGLFGLFDATINTLLRRKPENWTAHFRGIIEQDRILPECFLERQMEEEEMEACSRLSDEVCNVTVKLLNYSEEDNHVVRPGQIMSVHEVRGGGKLRDVYICVKAAKELLRVNAKSYLIKKIVLTQEMKRKILHPDMGLSEALWEVMSHAELRKKFGAKVDLKKWKAKIRLSRKEGAHDALDHIPLIGGIRDYAKLNQRS